MIDILSPIKVIFNIIIRLYIILDFIISNWGSVFTLKFWLFFDHIFDIKYQVSTIFNLKTSSQIKT